MLRVSHMLTRRCVLPCTCQPRQLRNCCSCADAQAAGCSQLGKELALQRKQLRLFRRPARTLYYFTTCACGAAASGAVWLARHRLTLFLLVPALLAYGSLKVTGASGRRGFKAASALGTSGLRVTGA